MLAEILNMYSSMFVVMAQCGEPARLREFYGLKVKDLMDKRSWDLPVVDKKTDIDHVFSILSGKNHVWVVESRESMKVVGVITEHDALSLLSPAYVQMHAFSRPNIRSFQIGLVTTAEEMMSKHLITAFPGESVTAVLARMKQHRVRRLPVVDEQRKLIGEITLHHLIYQYHKEHRKVVSSSVE